MLRPDVYGQAIATVRISVRVPAFQISRTLVLGVAMAHVDAAEKVWCGGVSGLWVLPFNAAAV